MSVRPIINPDAEPYTRTREHLRDHVERVRFMIKRYMRRFADRFLQAGGSYSDACVGPQELRRLAGLPETTEGQEFLDRVGFPTLDQLEGELLEHEHIIESRAAATLRGSLPMGSLSTGSLPMGSLSMGSISEDPDALFLPIEKLRDGFLLSPLELDLLLATAAPRLNIDIARFMTVAWADFTAKQPTAGFISEVVADSPEGAANALELLGDDCTLVQYRLLVPAQHPRWKPRTPRVHSLLQVPERILDFLNGHDTEKTSLIGCEVLSDGLDPNDLVLPDGCLEELDRHLRRPQARLSLLGPAAAGRRTVARSLVVQRGGKLLSVDVVRALTATIPEQVVVQLAEILREARLHHAALFLRFDGLGEGPLLEMFQTQLPRIQELFERFPDTIFIGCTSNTQKYVPLFFHEIPEVVLNAPNSAGQLILWNRALADAMGAERRKVVADAMATTYRLPPGAIFRALDVAREQSDDPTDLDQSTIIKMVRKQFDHGLGWLADAVSVNLGISDVVMSDEMRETIQEIIVYARNSETVFHKWGFNDKSPTGQGLSIMFSGPPGTGKSLMAGVLARELGRVCYRIDLSRVVDKYIGETEKNLGKVFDEADRAQAVLLFDEADSLFAKRTKVKSSNDRYANLEVNYLLQRLEAYAGVSILTTNFVTSIDEAFQRRIRFKLEFPLPNTEMRTILWRSLIPSSAPIDDEIDWENLGEMYEFSGGHIRNAVLRAAVHAADQSVAISEEMLIDAGTAESREMGKLVRRTWGEDPVN